MQQRLLEAARGGDLTIFDRIRKGEINDFDIVSAYDSKGYNIVQEAASCHREDFIVRASTGLKPELLAQLIDHKNNFGSNAFHAAAWFGCYKALTVLAEFYRSWMTSKNLPVFEAPWIWANYSGKTPLHDALDRKHDLIACYVLSLDPFNLYDRIDKEEQSPLFLAVKNGCHQFIDRILSPDLRLHVTIYSVSGPTRRTALHQAIIDRYEENILRKLVAKLQENSELIWQKDSKGWTALHYAAAQGVDWQVKLLLERHPPSNFKFDQNLESPLLLAAKSGHYSTVRTIIRCYPAMLEWLSEAKTTLLHHIQLDSRVEYQQFLQIPGVQWMINVTDENGMTPLHKAIWHGNFLLAEALFEKEGVNKAIQNNQGKTPIDLLIDKSHMSKEFAKLSKRPGIIPKGSYIQYKADLKEVRSTVMVVAALLATITFQAAFQIPDTTNNRTAALVVFLIADTFAACCSLVVLFWLLWAMVEEDLEKSRVLADRSFFVLELSFYGSLVAFGVVVFMIGLDKSLKLALASTIMCCFVPILSNKTIISKFVKVKRLPGLSLNLCSRCTYKPHSSQDGTSGQV